MTAAVVAAAASTTTVIGVHAAVDGDRANTSRARSVVTGDSPWEARQRAAPQAREARTARERASRSSSPVRDVEGVRGVAARMASMRYGWGANQFSCLDSLWQRESGWNARAANPSSGAYGIPQSLPGSKMAAFGSDWRTNPVTQIAWGLDYINGRYGSPCVAHGSLQSKGWY